MVAVVAVKHQQPTPVFHPLLRLPPPLSSTNFGNIAGAAAGSILAAAGAGSGLDALSNASANSSVRKLGGLPSAWALWALNTAGPSLEQSQASESGSEPCAAGGSLNYTFNDNDNDDDFSNGDSISFVASNCVAGVGELPINGGFAININAISYAGDEIIGASLSMSFTNFSSVGNTLNGSVTITVANNSVTSSYTNFSNTRGASSSAILNYTTVITSNGQLSISGLITVNNDTYTLSTISPIVFGAAYPIGGLLRVTDASGARVDIISNASAGGSFVCDLYLAGDQIRDAQIASVWSAL